MPWARIKNNIVNEKLKLPVHVPLVPKLLWPIAPALFLYWAVFTWDREQRLNKFYF